MVKEDSKECMCLDDGVLCESCFFSGDELTGEEKKELAAQDEAFMQEPESLELAEKLAEQTERFELEAGVPNPSDLCAGEDDTVH